MPKVIYIIFKIYLLWQYVYAAKETKAPIKTNSRAYCYTGSSMYESQVIDCRAKNPLYNGTWYCSRIKICEKNIPTARSCVLVRGCATEDECTLGGMLKKPASVHPDLQINEQYPFGMVMSPSCCQAEMQPDDDVVALDYDKVCNVGTKLHPISGGLLFVLLVGSLSSMLLYA